MHVATLPLVDEHARVVDAGAGDVWTALVGTVDRPSSTAWAARYARLVGCADRTVSGPRPLAAGSTLPGFHVVAAVPGSELELAGRHRFSVYSLTFRLEPVTEPGAAGRTRLSAETRAAFPGPAGLAYRLLVVGSRGHAVVVRRLLAGVAARAEAESRHSPDPGAAGRA
jgi:hypothetical protein